MSNKITIITILFFNCFITAFSQKQGKERIDSLLTTLNNKVNDTVQYNAYLETGTFYQNINPDSAIYYHSHSADIAKSLNDPFRQAQALGKIGWDYYLSGNYESARKFYAEAINLQIPLNKQDTLWSFRIKKFQAAILIKTAYTYDNQGNYKNSLEYVLKALAINEMIHNRQGIVDALVLMGRVYDNIAEYEKSLNCYFRALAINKEIKNEQSSAAILGNIGITYHNKGDNIHALKYYSQAGELAETMNYLPGMSVNFSNMGDVYYDLNDYAKSLQYYFKALKIAEESDNENSIGIILGNIGLIYVKQRKIAEARDYLNRALQMSHKTGNLLASKNGYQNFSELDSLTGNYKDAFEHYKLYLKFRDSLYNEEKAKEITRKEMQYDFDKKEAIAKAEQEKKDTLTRAEIQKQKFIRNSITGGAALILLFSLASFFLYKRKRDAEQKQKETLLSLQVSETEMKALRSQMNPHFIFNALQSIQTFLLSHKPEEANSYLLKFSKLMRAVLENSQHSEVSLKEDMLALELYMQLESIRLSHPFTYQFHIDSSVDVENDTIPPLILQPFVENAIWHGLQYKSGPGHIAIFIAKKDNALFATVEDNGIGRLMSKQVSQPMLLKKESLGMKLTEERLKILNEQKNIKAQFKVTDLFTKNDEPAGTKIELSLPLVA